MDASQAPSEADDGALPEMAANEAPARELAADKHHLQTSNGGKDVAHPVASSEECEEGHNTQDAVEARPPQKSWRRKEPSVPVGQSGNE